CKFEALATYTVAVLIDALVIFTWCYRSVGGGTGGEKDA
ncbi:hypothetical protein C7406_1331, partial [Paraburkholderia caballeronis]